LGVEAVYLGQFRGALLLSQPSLPKLLVVHSYLFLLLFSWEIDKSRAKRIGV
jgi:hypothetical protein